MNRKLIIFFFLGLGTAQPVVLFAQPKLASPSNANAVAVSEGRVDVSWTDTTTKEDGFEVYRSATGVNGMFTLVARTGAGATAIGDIGLNPSTQYCYRVRALATLGNRTTFSAFSNTACATTPTPPSQPGAIRISTATSGFDADVDGYFVRVDKGPDQAIGTNAAVTVTGLAAGDHAVFLGHVASNCSVENNPRTVSVTGGATTDAVFAVTCGDGPTIQLTTLTTGENIDADGYGVMVWQRSTGSRILRASAGVPANGTVRFFGLTTGEYDVEINGIAGNCMQVNTLPMVDLTGGGTVALALNVACTQPTGGAEICDNGIDDDGDGLVDLADPDCASTCWDCSFFTCPAGFICGFDGCCVAHCGDGQMNGTEGDVDCGGDCAVNCQAGQHCWTNADCESNVCFFDRCQ